MENPSPQQPRKITNAAIGNIAANMLIRDYGLREIRLYKDEELRILINTLTTYMNCRKVL